MIRYFCDICKKEIEAYEEIKDKCIIANGCVLKATLTVIDITKNAVRPKIIDCCIGCLYKITEE